MAHGFGWLQIRTERAAAFLLGGSLALGFAHIAILPPWEGFDEPYHYSYVQQLSETGELPSRETARVSQDVARYALAAPMPYELTPPVTYHSFFDPSKGAANRSLGLVHKLPARPRQYEPSNWHNSERKHPPLYYVLLTPIYRLTRHLSWGAHLFSLRLASYLLAWLALALAVWGCLRLAARADSPRWQWAALGTALWPLLFPAWFPEMARMGNDSLCALIATLVWLATVHRAGSRVSVRFAVATGILLGLGCLTKAFFVPFAVSIVLWWVIGGAGRSRWASVGLASVAALTACAIAAWWYLDHWDTYFRIATSARTDGLVNGLSRNFSLWAWLRGHAAFVTTVAWSGTWSLARPQYGFLFPLSSLVILTAVAYAAALRRARVASIEWLPVWFSLPMLVALSYYVLVRVAATGEGKGAVGYYLHVLVGPLGFAVGLGLCTAQRSPAFRRVFRALAVYAVGFGVAISWAQVMLFSGLLVKGPDKFYHAPAPLPSLLGVPEAFARLQKLAYPGVAAIAWCVGASLALAGLGFAYAAIQNLPLTRREASSPRTR